MEGLELGDRRVTNGNFFCFFAFFCLFAPRDGQGFVKALNELLAGRNEIIANIRLIKKTLCKTADLEKEKDALEQELTVVADMIQNLVSENARVAQDQGDYQKRYDALMERYDSVQASIDEDKAMMFRFREGTEIIV